MPRAVTSPIEVSDLPTDLDPRARMELLILQQIRDNLQNLDSKVNEVRERMIKMEATKLEEKILELKQETRQALDNADTKINDVELKLSDRITKAELQIERWRGTILPIAIVLTAAVTGTVAFLLKLIYGS